MAASWIEWVTGSIEENRRYRQYKARIEQLPESYHTAVAALERYTTYLGGLGDGASILAMLEDLADLFEQGVADGTPVREIVGEDPVEFAETFLSNYPKGQWIKKERERLSTTIDRVAGARG